MNNFDLGRMINRLIYKQPLINQQNMQGKATGSGFIQNQASTQFSNSTQNLTQNIQQNLLAQNTQSTANLQMNTLQSIDRANYAREIMQLPKNMNELVFIIQKGITQAQFNKMYPNQVAAQKMHFHNSKHKSWHSCKAWQRQIRFKQLCKPKWQLNSKHL